MGNSGSFWAFATFLLLALCIGLAAVFETAGFYARFGSILVALAVTIFGVQKYFDSRPGKPIRGSRPIHFFELAMIVIGTLQWGYGDLFHCWINGKGWTVC